MSVDRTKHYCFEGKATQGIYDKPRTRIVESSKLWLHVNNLPGVYDTSSEAEGNVKPEHDIYHDHSGCPSTIRTHLWPGSIIRWHSVILEPQHQ